MKTKTLITFSLICILPSCSHRTTVMPGPEPTTNTSLQPDSIASQRARVTWWILNLQHSKNSYQSSTQSIIATIDGSSTRRDSADIITEFTLDIHQLGAVTHISGEITRVVPTVIHSESLILPMPFSAMIESGYFTLEPALIQSQDELCNSGVTQILGEIRTAISAWPTSLSIGTTWSDSTSTTTCAGNRIPAVLNIIRHYQLAGQDEYRGQPMLAINRTDSIRLAAQGTQIQHQLELNASGIARTRILIDSRSGVMNAMETTQQLQLTIKASGRPHRFQQETRQSIKLNR